MIKTSSPDYFAVYKSLGLDTKNQFNSIALLVVVWKCIKDFLSKDRFE